MSSAPYNELQNIQNAKRSSNQQNNNYYFKDKKSRIIYIVIFTILAFVIEALIRAPFTTLSEYIQSNLTFSWKCALGDYFVWFKYQGKTFIFLFLYNVSNIYTSLSMILLDSFGIFINGTLKLIYCDPRPYWRNENLIPCGCATNYGNPSTTSLDVYLVCIVVYKGLINRYKTTSWKVLVWIFFLVPQILAWTSRFIQNIHSLPQLTFGLVIGYIIQYVYFEILEVDMNSTEQLKKLVNHTSFLVILAVSCFAWLLCNGIHYYLINVEYNNNYLHTIERYCNTIDFYMFDNESYQKTAKAFLFIGCIIGVYIEYNLYFEGNYNNFAKYNMGLDNWTRTSGEKIAIRLTMMIYVMKFVGSKTKFGNINYDSIAYLILGKCIISMFVAGIFYFCVFKYLFRGFGLTNEKNNVNSNNDYRQINDYERNIDKDNLNNDGNKDIDYKKQ